MKNIHVLPTDKPSRLIINWEKDLCYKSKPYLMEGTQNIYITSNEVVVKDNIWSIRTRPGKPILARYLPINNDNYLFLKIILTTDQDLIKEGVQAIDDDFLEWFVKNSSCDNVEVDEEFLKLVHNPNYVNHTPDSDDLQYGETIIEEEVINYKIIIPKEDLGYTTNLGAEVSDEMARALMIPKELFGLRQFVGSSSKYKDEDFSASLSDEMGQWLRPNKVTRVEQVKDLQFWRENAEEDYLRVPISVLKYISKLETELETVYREEEVRGILIKFHNELPNRWEIDKWFEQFKKK
jgi:hypothetical protein